MLIGNAVQFLEGHNSNFQYEYLIIKMELLVYVQL